MTTDTNPQNGNKFWIGNRKALRTGATAFKEALSNVGRPVFVVAQDDQPAVTHSGTMIWGEPIDDKPSSEPLMGFAAPVLPSDLGDAGFKRDLGIRYAYVAGAMANGITSVEMVEAAGKAGMIGFFGAGGLSLEQIGSAIDRLNTDSNQYPFGFNLIHSPHDPQLEAATVELYLARSVKLVSASAYLALTLPLVYYRVKGIHQTPDGNIVCPNRVVAKVSRVEVARRFFAPPPEKMLNELVHQGKITEREAHLAKQIPLAQDMTAEADSGGHTDNRPALALLPAFINMRDDALRQYKFQMPLRVGLGGGIATPDATAAAFALGAAYVLTGSINQSCVEAGTSEMVRQMLAVTGQADVVMAPAADMFEMGVKVQVLKRGTMFAMRGAKLYDLYRSFDQWEQIDPQTRNIVERDMLRATFEESWLRTKEFFKTRDPSQIERAEQNPKHKMALVFRSYLGRASLWAKTGDASRQMDFQVWCGPAMGAFNAWVKGTFLEKSEQRLTATIGMNLLYGAAGLIRCNWLRSQGITLPMHADVFKPVTLEEIEKRIRS